MIVDVSKYKSKGFNKCIAWKMLFVTRVKTQMKLNNRILFCSCLFLVKSASVLSSKYFFWTYCLSWFNNPFVWKPKRKKHKQACKAASINLGLMFNRKEMWKDQDSLISLSIIRNFKNRLYIWIKNYVLNVEKQHEALRMSQLVFISLNLPPNLKYFKSKLLFIAFFYTKEYSDFMKGVPYEFS